MSGLFKAGTNHAVTSVYGSDVAVQLRSCTEHACGVAEEPRADPNARCKHHGQCAVGEHHAVWNVLVDDEPGSDCSDFRGARCLHACPVRSCDPGAVDAARVTHGPNRKHAGAR